MPIANASTDSIEKAIQRGDDVFHLRGTVDAVVVPGDSFPFWTGGYIVQSGVQGVMVGQNSDLDLWQVLWGDPATGTSSDVAGLDPWAPLTWREPPSTQQSVTLFSGRSIDVATLIEPVFGPGQDPPVADIWFALKPGLFKAQKRAPKYIQRAGVVIVGPEEPVAFLYAYGRKSLTVNVWNPGANPITVRVAGRAMVPIPGAPTTFTALETTLVTAPVLGVNNFKYATGEEEIDYDAIVLYITGPSADPHVAFRMEVRD